MPQYAGMPEDRFNVRISPCGCQLVRVALPGNPWRLMKPCDAHKEA